MFTMRKPNRPIWPILEVRVSGRTWIDVLQCINHIGNFADLEIPDSDEKDDPLSVS
jgi:hypothetical protein